jgi:hypothetical protein
VPYKKFKEAWGPTRHGHEFDRYKIRRNFVSGRHGQFSRPKRVPLHLVTWGMIKNGDKFSPFDVYELAGIDREREGFESLTQILDRTGADKKEITGKFLSFVEKRLAVNADLLSGLYNNIVLPSINDSFASVPALSDMRFAPKDPKAITHTVSIGYSRGLIDKDGMGGGPQSHQTFHVMSVIYPDLEEVRDRISVSALGENNLLQRSLPVISRVNTITGRRIVEEAQNAAGDRLNPSAPEFQLVVEKRLEFQIESITRQLEQQGWDPGRHGANRREVAAVIGAEVAEVTKYIELFSAFTTDNPNVGPIDFMKPEELSPELIFKQVDPYGTLFYDLFSPFVISEIKKNLHSAGISGTVDELRQNTYPLNYDMRTAEWWAVTTPHASLAEANAALLPFYQTMYNLWTEGRLAWEKLLKTNDDSAMRDFQSKYNLTDSVISVLESLHPTELQIEQLYSQIKSEPEVSGDTSRLDRELRILKRREARVDRDPKLLSEDNNEIPIFLRALNFGYTQLLKAADASGNPIYNKGYNIPAVPGFGVRYEQTEEGWIIYISPLLSQKGVAEQVWGSPMLRAKGKS